MLLFPVPRCCVRGTAIGLPELLHNVTFGPLYAHPLLRVKGGTNLVAYRLLYARVWAHNTMLRPP